MRARRGMRLTRWTIIRSIFNILSFIFVSALTPQSLFLPGLCPADRALQAIAMPDNLIYAGIDIVATKCESITIYRLPLAHT